MRRRNTYVLPNVTVVVWEKGKGTWLLCQGDSGQSDGTEDNRRHQEHQSHREIQWIKHCTGFLMANCGV